MTELDRGRGAAFFGFTASAALLALTVGAYFNGTFAHLGWRGGEYAYAFVWTASGLTVVGGVIIAFFVLLATSDRGISVP